MNIVWTTDDIAKVPSPKEIDQMQEFIKEVFNEQIEQLQKAFINGTGLTMMIPWQDWYLDIQLAPDTFLNMVMVKPLTENEWLDRINEMEKNDSESGWYYQKGKK